MLRRSLIGLLLAVVLIIGGFLSPAQTQPTNIELILDASASMGETMAGRVKIDAAKDALKQLLNTLPYSYNIGLRLYGHRVAQGQREQSCQDSELVHPIGPLDADARTAMLQKLEGIQPKGLTPLALSLEKAVNDLSDTAGRNFIILVSDGEETCGGDPIASAEYVLSLGVKIYVIGFDIISPQLEGIAEHGGGKYYSATNTGELVTALKEAIQEATGWLFFDDFEGGIAPLWSCANAGAATWQVEHEALTVGNAQEDLPMRCFVGDMQWEDYSVDVDVLYDGCYYDNCAWTRDNQVAIFIRVEDTNNMIAFFLQSGGQSGFKVKKHGLWSDFMATGDVPQLNNAHVLVIAEGSSYNAIVNDQLIATFNDDTISHGYAGFQFARDRDRRVYFDNFTVTAIPGPASAEAIAFFNKTGDDLRGVFKDTVSQHAGSISIAIHDFTDADLADYIAGIAQNRTVRLLLDSEGEGAQDGQLVCQQLSITVEVRHISHMNHNYMIIGDRTVLTGSANWTLNSLEEDANDVLMIFNRDVARAYREEFEGLWSEASEGCY